MCLNAGDVWPFCDECWDKHIENPEEAELCPECKKLAERICEGCEDIFKNKDELVDGLCPKCRTGG